MLIEFSVGNYRSFKETQTLSLVQAKGGELVDSNTFSADGLKSHRLLRSAMVCGPNAGGKTNLLAAIGTMSAMVAYSASDASADIPHPIEPFLLDDKAAREPSEFEAVIMVDQVRYQYGFAATPERVTEEWLIAYPHGRGQRWFEREWHNDCQSYRWKMGPALTGSKRRWQESTRPNSLFLSAAVQSGSAQLRPIYGWFSQNVQIVSPSGSSLQSTVGLCKDESAYKAVLGFLNEAGIGIHAIRVEHHQVHTERVAVPRPVNLMSTIPVNIPRPGVDRIKAIHKSPQGKPIELDMDDESDGTRKLFALAGPFYLALSRGGVLVCDELHSSLHTGLMRYLLGLFHQDSSNPHNAQLVFSTHDTSIMNQEVLRRDQIWFCKQNKCMASQLVPLTDFHPRKGRENVELYYRSGRYGAVPYVPPVGYLSWSP